MEQLKHECGVAMIRLLKPLEYYRQKYGTTRYGLAKLYLMMEKQHNRGQDGAGLACVSLGAKVGEEYMFRERAEGKDAITEIFDAVDKSMAGEEANGMTTDAELLMGHLRYSTTGRSGLKYVHPFLRRNNWRAKNLALCGNFNMTNIDEVFGKLTAQGQSPRFYGDAYITLELMGHRLDREVERLYAEARQRQLRDTDITRYIDDHVEMGRVLRSTMPLFDGGYVMCGITGSGEMFAVRDPWGIRPAFWYQDDEVVVVASERPVIQTCFNLDADRIAELLPGQMLAVKRCGEVSTEQIVPPQETRKCSFERIYFSRGSDCDIYRERKQLGRLLTPAISRAIGGDVANTVFSYIPNTAEVAFYGMTDGMRQMHGNIRVEKVVWKDIKLRTFISDVGQRNDLAAHVYDVSYGSLRPYEDNLVIIDDSIVRGTTLRESIFKILDRLHPKKIVMVSSSPQIRYPDYYGIDMSHLEELCAAEMLRPEGMEAPVEMVFQSIEGLHRACPGHQGDWYFTGHYPTPGGIRMVNRAFVGFVEQSRWLKKNYFLL